jgi:hypothetical protein
MVFDADHQRAVMFGGTFGLGAVTDEMWAWDGLTWTLLPTGSPQPPRLSNHVMGFDPLHHQIVVFGGTTTGDFADATGDTWLFDTSTEQWSRGPAGPLPRADAAMAWNNARRRLVMFGGFFGSSLLADTWEWDGSAWSVIDASGPSARVGHTMASTQTGVVMIGGNVGDAFELEWAGDVPDDTCQDEKDSDGDGLRGCADPDCLGVCAPTCTSMPDGSAPLCIPTGPRCGDGTCDPLENCRICAQDCPCTPVCGDGFCDGPDETQASCAGDCS